MEVQILTYGAIISKILVPDKNGKHSDVVLGFDNVKGQCYFLLFHLTKWSFKHNICTGEIKVEKWY